MIVDYAIVAAIKSDAIVDSYSIVGYTIVDAIVDVIYDQHWSKDIWSGQVTGPGGEPVTVRQPHRVYNLDKHVRPFVIASGFYEISRIRSINLGHGLISALDVATLTGLPIDGAPVTGPGEAFDPNELCLHLLRRVSPQTAFRGDNLKLTCLESEFQTHPDEAIENQLIMYARVYITYLFGGVIFTSSAGNAVHVFYLTLLEKFWLIRTYNWGAAMLAYLYQQLCKACMKTKRQIAEWLLFLQDKLDAQQPHQIIWMSYTEAIIIASSPACREASNLWLAQIPLHCFDIVEMHFPDPIMRRDALHLLHRVLQYVYYLLWETRKAASTLREGVDEMGHAMANNTLDLCRYGLQEAGEAKHLDPALAEDEIAFRERGQVFRDAGPSTSVPSTSMSWKNGSVPGPSSSWGGGDPSTTTPSHSTRWGDW
ncbi:Serine/threonine-protein phosphatase 7 long form like [Actinidia chinensis var. chinensis]|uniref:Serine/threonine-protein phosphatase 7 long form like n=1 Tax=Actinidia chinensis var. chinensis TaxID=1590841 RepID=A0A2R6RIR6_ACTCC|nr:Serine/threonine-protein phosphatase 7 long form like [Actinidia chinensis var. chinensis]